MMRTVFFLVLMFLFGLAWLFMQPAAGPQLPAFDPKTQIRIEFPVFGGGGSQGIAPIVHEETTMTTALGQLSYEITNNVLTFRGRHYLLKTGDILRFQKLDAISINDKKVMSIEDVLCFASISCICVWP